MSTTALEGEILPADSGEPAYTALLEPGGKSKPPPQRPPKDTLAEKLAARAPPDHVLLNRKETAVYLGISPKSLEKFGATRYHQLKYSIIGNRAMYRLSDVADFVQLKRKGGAS